MIYLSTAIGLTPAGSSTIHIYTRTIRRTTQITFLWGRTALLLSCRCCTIYHAYPTRTAFHLFWHCWLGAGWAVHCG